MLCDQLGHDRRNWGACPRSYLKDMITRAAAAGITVQASFENEYYLARWEEGRFVPYDVNLVEGESAGGTASAWAFTSCGAQIE